MLSHFILHTGSLYRLNMLECSQMSVWSSYSDLGEHVEHTNSGEVKSATP